MSAIPQVTGPNGGGAISPDQLVEAVSTDDVVSLYNTSEQRTVAATVGALLGATGGSGGGSGGQTGGGGSGGGGGQDGADGASAYEIAVAGGFPGTEAEWLASLRGEAGDDGQSAYDAAVAAGFIGTIDEWLNSLQGGPVGPPGASAYEIAVANGFPGTETEWLASFEVGPQGASAYEVAVASGFVGTEAEWLASLQNGPAGADGSSAFEVAVSNGFTGIESEWLASLRGEAGADGRSAYDLAVEAGFAGTEADWLSAVGGEDGADGEAGASAYEVAVANGFSGTEAEWLDSLRGPEGPPVDFTTVDIGDVPITPPPPLSGSTVTEVVTSALGLVILQFEKGIPNGVAQLDIGGTVPEAQLPNRPGTAVTLTPMAGFSATNVQALAEEVSARFVGGLKARPVTVATQADRLALPTSGDMYYAIQESTKTVWLLAPDADPSDATNWVKGPRIDTPQLPGVADGEVLAYDPGGSGDIVTIPLPPIPGFADDAAAVAGTATDLILTPAALAAVLNNPTSGFIALTEKGAADGVASLGADGLVPAAQLPAPVFADAAEAAAGTVADKPIAPDTFRTALDARAQINRASGGVLGLNVETVAALSHAADGDVAIDLAVAVHLAVDLNAEITGFTATNLVNGAMNYVVLHIAQGGGFGAAWTVNGVAVKWAGGVAPVLSPAAGDVDRITLWTYDDGVSWFGQAAQGFA